MRVKLLALLAIKAGLEDLAYMCCFGQFPTPSSRAGLTHPDIVSTARLPTFHSPSLGVGACGSSGVEEQRGVHTSCKGCP